MRKTLLFFLLLVPVLVSAQASTQVTVLQSGGKGLRDQAGVVWSNGTYRFDFVGSPTVTWPGGTVPRTITGVTDANGNFTVSIPNNNTINPSPTSWTVTLCPNPQVTGASSKCAIQQNVFITGASYTVNVTPPSLSIPGTTPWPVAAYDDSEITPVVTVGFNYLNVENATTPVYRTCFAVANNACTSWQDIAANSTCCGGGGGGLPSIPSGDMIFVDGGRTDSYTADGTLAKPFKTIMAGVNQVIANGDNSLAKPYVISINPSTYTETIDIGNAKIVNLSLFAAVNEGVIVNPPAGNALQSTANNDGFLTGSIVNIDFRGPVIFSDPTNNGSMGVDQINLVNNLFEQGITVQNAQTFQFYTNTFYGPTIFQNINNTLLYPSNVVGFGGGSFAMISDSTQPVPGSFFGTYVLLLGSEMVWNGPIAINGPDAGTQLDVLVGSIVGTVGGVMTIQNGALVRNFHGSTISDNITVNAGGELRSIGGAFRGSISNSGTYSQQGTIATASIVLGGANLSSGSGAPNGTVAAPPGSIYLNLAGGATNTLWVKETGTGSTGWVAK